MAKNLTKIWIKKNLNSTAEIDNNKAINDFLGLETFKNFDIYKEGCYIIEAKLNINDTKNGLAKAKQELKIYANKLKLEGLKLPVRRLILDYETGTIYNEDGSENCKLEDFDFACPEEIENYDITFENGPNVAQQIYSRHKKIKDSNIFEWFKSGIDWYNPTELTQTDYRLVLDLFNDPQTQKKRGAFYTPDSSVKISTKYLRNIIKNLPKDKDYVILDRCAGSGQLEKFLTDEELSHCILSTLGVAEWISLWNTYGDKVRNIIPPYVNGKQIERDTTPQELSKQVDFKNNEIIGANALTENFYKDNEKLWKNKIIILLENPPYAEASNGVGKDAKEQENNKKISDTYIKELMKKQKLGNAGNDLDNQFIWSAWNVVKCDYYIHYGPVKSWKSLKFYDKTFLEGSLVNRIDFHATEGGISIISWKNIDANNEELILDYTIKNPESEVLENKKITIKKVYKSVEANIVKPNAATKKEIEENKVIALLKETSFLHKFGTSRLVSYNNSNKKSLGHDIFGVTEDNLDLYCIAFANGQYQCKDFTEKEVLMKTADQLPDEEKAHGPWENDEDLIEACKIWTYYSSANKCDESCSIWSILKNSITSLDNNLKLKANNVIKLANNKDKKPKDLPDITEWIGLENIDKKYNIKEEDSLGKMVAQNVQLDIAIKELKEELKKYYSKKIEPKLFEYELLK